MNQSATQEIPHLCVGQNSLPRLHDSVFVRIYCATLIQSTILHPIDLIYILMRHSPSIQMMSFAGVLVDNLHKTSIIVFVFSRVSYGVSVLFNILINGKL